MLRSFGERLRAARRKRGLNQRALAEASCTTQAMISLYEGSARVPDLDVQIRLAIALDAPDLIENEHVRRWWKTVRQEQRRVAS